MRTVTSALVGLLALVACASPPEGAAVPASPSTTSSAVAPAAAVSRAPRFAPLFASLIGDLKANPRVKVTKASAQPPATSEQLETVKKRLGVSDGVLTLWAETNGVEVSWEGPYGTKGNIAIPPLDQAFKDGKGNVYQDTTPADDPLRKFYIIDDFAPGNPESVGIVLDGTDAPSVFYLTDYAPHPLGYHLFEYCQALTKSRGFDYWQEAVNVDRTAEKKDSIMSSIEFRLLMPRVFPGFQLSDLLQGDYAARDQERVQKAQATITKLSTAFKAAGVKFKTSERDALVGKVDFRVAKGADNVKKASKVLVDQLGSAWKDLGGGAMSVGDILVEIRDD